jgi:hypothetical protein
VSQPPDLVTRYSGGDDHSGGIRPDFVLVGLPLPDGTVELWASTKLSYAELEAETRFRPHLFEDLVGRIDYPAPEPVSHTFTLRAGLRKFIIVRAPDYRAALEALITDPSWDPGSAGDGPLAIGGG